MGKITLIGIYSSSKFVRVVHRVVMNILSVPLIIFLYLLKPFKTIKLFRTFHDDRIGHLSMNTDLFLTKMKLQDPREKNDEYYIGFCSDQPANTQLMLMFIRAYKAFGIPLFQVPTWFYQSVLQGLLNKKSWFGKSRFYVNLECNSNEYWAWSNGVMPEDVWDKKPYLRSE